MPQRYPHMPRRRRLTKSRQREIVRLLSSLPRSEPPIDISHGKSLGFEPIFQECDHHFVLPQVGAEALYAEYDADDGSFLEATLLNTARRVKARGVWCFEVRETGGDYLDGSFNIYWDWAHYFHVGRSPTPDSALLNDWIYLCPPPVRLTPSEEVKLADDSMMEGPAAEHRHFAGYAVVTVGGIEHPCMRLLRICQWGEKPESSHLDDIYVSEAGRTVLVRRYQTLESYLECMDMASPKSLEAEREKNWPAGRAKITYNGQAFYHWFDSLTDQALRPLMDPQSKTHISEKRNG
jgi:hypothetical protein